MPIRHIVLAKIKPDADVTTALSGVVALKDTIPGILNAHGGPTVSPEGLERGYTHGITIDFTDRQAVLDYLPHPAHREAASALLSVTEGGKEGILVFDIEIE